MPVEVGAEAVLRAEFAAKRAAGWVNVREGAREKGMLGEAEEDKEEEEAGGGGCGAAGGEPKAAADLKYPEGSYSSDEEVGGAEWGLDLGAV